MRNCESLYLIYLFFIFGCELYLIKLLLLFVRLLLAEEL